jgi:hypothetical protein
VFAELVNSRIVGDPEVIEMARGLVLSGDSKKNVLVPRFFLLFSLLDVPYISKGLRLASLSAWDLSDG